MHAENDLVLVYVSILTWVKCGGRDLLCFFIRAGSIGLFFCVGVEIDLIFVYGPKMTRF